MANPEHLAILQTGVAAWNRWRADTMAMPECFRGIPKPDLSQACLQRVMLRGANFGQVNLRNAKLTGADLLNVDLAEADLTAADLSESRLDESHFLDAECENANLSGATLSGVKFVGTNLTRADLSRADLYEAMFHHANLEGSNLGGANLCGAIVFNSILSGSDMSDAEMLNTILAECDLSKVRGLESIQHTGPSPLSLDTIFKSRGKIPESFLRGCGVPESFITQMRALVNAEDGIQFYSSFISYSTKDGDFARRLHGKRRDAHLRVWFAPEDIKGGAKLHEQIEAAIRVYDKLLIVLSEASMRSEWVKDEMCKAFREEYDSARAGRKKRKLFPVRLCDYATLENWVCNDSQSGIDLAEEVRQYFIPDFSQWKEHDQFEASFARLLKDLKADELEP